MGKEKSKVEQNLKLKELGDVVCGCYDRMKLLWLRVCQKYWEPEGEAALRKELEEAKAALKTSQNELIVELGRVGKISLRPDMKRFLDDRSNNDLVSAVHSFRLHFCLTHEQAFYAYMMWRETATFDNVR